MSVTDVQKDPQALTMAVTAEYEVSVERAWELFNDPRQLEHWWGPAHLSRHGRRPRPGSRWSRVVLHDEPGGRGVPRMVARAGG